MYLNALYTYDDVKEDEIMLNDTSTSTSTSITRETIANKQNDMSTTIIMSCEDVQFWQGLFRGGLMPFDDCKQTMKEYQSRSRSLKLNSSIRRWNANTRNVTRILSGCEISKSSASVPKSSDSSGTRRGRRKSIVDVLKQMETKGGDDSGSNGLSSSALEIESTASFERPRFQSEAGIDDEYPSEFAAAPSKKGCCVVS